MFRFAKNVAAALALSGLVLSQPALAVRSSESLPAPGAKVTGKVQRMGSVVGSNEQFVGVPIVGVFIGIAIVISVIAVVASDSNEAKSPG